MKRVLEQAESLKKTETYDELQTAARLMELARAGMLTPREMDAMKLLRPCMDLRRKDPALARQTAEAVRDFCLELDRYYTVDRRMWIVLGRLLGDDPFALPEEYDLSVLREEYTEREIILTPWDVLTLDREGLTPWLTDPAVYAAAAAYIRRRGRARFAVRRWLMEDMDRFYGERTKPTFSAAEALSFHPEPDACFQTGAAPAAPYRRGQRLKLRLMDERGMDFLPEVRILGDRKRSDGREARGWAWYHGERWLLRILYDPERPTEARVRRYTISPLEFRGFHVVMFAVLEGNFGGRIPVAGDAIRVRLMDLWGRDVPLRGRVTETYPGCFDLRAAFPDGKERQVRVHPMDGYDELQGVATVGLWEKYLPPTWATREAEEG